MMSEKYATIEILDDGETTIFGAPNGRYMVREYERGENWNEELGATFYESIQDAEKHVLDYQRQAVCGRGDSNED